MATGKGGNTVQRVFELVQPITDELGIFLWDVCFEKEGATWYLRVFIDRDEGISMDDCEAVTRPLNKKLDEEDFISQAYVLEVGSPGLARELKRPIHFEAYLGDRVKVRLIRPNENGVKEFTGILKFYEKDSIEIEAEDKTYIIKQSEAAYIKADDDSDLFKV